MNLKPYNAKTIDTTNTLVISQTCNASIFSRNLAKIIKNMQRSSSMSLQIWFHIEKIVFLHVY